MYLTVLVKAVMTRVSLCQSGREQSLKNSHVVTCQLTNLISHWSRMLPRVVHGLWHGKLALPVTWEQFWSDALSVATGELYVIRDHTQSRNGYCI